MISKQALLLRVTIFVTTKIKCVQMIITSKGDAFCNNETQDASMIPRVTIEPNNSNNTKTNESSENLQLVVLCPLASSQSQVTSSQ